MKVMRNNPRYISGFSLIELIVAVGIFSVTATFAMGTLLTLTNAQRKAAALQAAFDNVRYALEAMAKDMRTGTTYTCLDAGGNPTASYPCPTFRYVNTAGATIQYTSSSNQIQKRINGGTAQAVTDPGIYISQLDFYLIGGANGDNVQPSVTIAVKGTAGRSRANVESTIQLQTSVTPRKLQP